MAIVRDRAFDAPVDKGMDSNNFAITPSDTVNMPVAPQSINATTAGNVAMLMPDGVTATFVFAAGETKFVNSPIRVLSTGTTATGLTGLASKALRR
jgi:hypothetical protein